MADRTRQVLLEARNVSVRYKDAGRQRDFTALDGVNLTVSQGESIAVLGRNGAGKSTLLKALTGLVPLATGQVRAVSTPVLLSVHSALLPDLTGRENAYLGSLALGMSAADARAAIGDILEFSGLAHAQDRPLRTYSTGMAARLKFAICTAKPQDVLIMDEALSVGDQEFQLRCRDRLEKVTRSSGAVLLTSHSLPLLEKTCNRAVLVDGAALVYDGAVGGGIDMYKAQLATSPD